MFELDNDAQETFRVYPRPFQVQVPAAKILVPQRSFLDGPLGMWVGAGGLDASAILTGYVTTEYLTSTGDVFGQVCTVLGSGNGRLAVGVAHMLPASAYRRIG